MNYSDKLTTLKGVGEVQATKLETLGLETIADLINYYPRRYDDYSNVSEIAKLTPGATSIEATVNNAKGRRLKGRLHITEAIASDASGSVRLIWFNQPYRADSFKKDQKYYISGNYELSKVGHFQIMNPSVEAVSDLPVNTARILAVYRETKGLNSRDIRKAIKQTLPLIEKTRENLPEYVIKEHDLLSRSEALKLLHRPGNSEQLEEAKYRLGFEEVFEFTLASLLNKEENKHEQALSIPFKEALAKDFVVHLPFKLTDGQRIAIWQTYKDIEKPMPMNRLIEGDVGSGKTVVATMAALMVLAAKKQVALMAPTELLARQHADTIHSLLEPLGYQNQVVLLVGSMSAKQKKSAYEAIAKGKAGFIIGTQALIQENLDMKNLALVVIDEQHRFGVKQRQLLMSKAGHMPHLLSLSATPIPRSLALTLYGELDITRLKDKPLGRQEMETKIVYPSEQKDLYEFIDKEIAAGRQAFIVCPSISESSLIEAKAAETVYEELKKGHFKHRKLGLLHGKLKPNDKQGVMEQFVDKKLDILVSTTVIEVGVDVPNAVVMLIMSPERFGLAQLHQLRGRVGRGKDKGYFFMLLDNSDAPLKRLRALASSSDGFDLAELDLRLRGPGAIYGTMQHGALDLRIANLSDRTLITDALSAAKQFIERKEDLKKYKDLNKKIETLRTVTNLN